MATDKPFPGQRSGSDNSTKKRKIFHWKNAVIYHLLIDRFCDGNKETNHSYRRGIDTLGRIIHPSGAIGSFHGGDLIGLTQKVREGYFCSLGVDALWVSAPFEQVHGWVVGGNEQDGYFHHYGYHGYWIQDWTSIDSNVGTREQWSEFVAEAHARGLRVIVDIVMNHPGYGTMLDILHFEFGKLKPGWRKFMDSKTTRGLYPDVLNEWIDSSEQTQDAWSKFWGTDWIRANLPGYAPPGNDEYTMNVDGLPDFYTECDVEVELPPLLIKKWGAVRTTQEQRSCDDFFAKRAMKPTVRNYLIKWLTDWIRLDGIDGFRVDTARNVELPAWKLLKEESIAALREWKAANPKAVLDDTEFWMVAEAYGHGLVRDEYFANGFDAKINFSFSNRLKDHWKIEDIYAEQARLINGKDAYQVLSYVSSHDDGLFDRVRLYDGAAMLIFAPGAVQIEYGDEIGRKVITGPAPECYRSMMPWNELDESLRNHWGILIAFRRRHQSVGAGSHQMVLREPYVFVRRFEQDVVMVGFGMRGHVLLPVRGVFHEGALIREAYSDHYAFVTRGSVRFDVSERGVVLLEEVQLV